MKGNTHLELGLGPLTVLQSEKKLTIGFKVGKIVRKQKLTLCKNKLMCAKNTKCPK